MQVFLSYSHADKGLATRLRQSLEESGLSFSAPSEAQEAGVSWRQQLEKAIRSSDAILLLLGSPQRADEWQQLTWRLALEAAWEDSTKPLIPILLYDAELPAFVRSGASGDRIQAVRIREPKGLEPAVQAILRTLDIGARDVREKANGGLLATPPSPGSLPPKSGITLRSTPIDFVQVIENYPAVTDKDRMQRQERLSAIKQYAEQLKH
jgi:hypothetical protein